MKITVVGLGCVGTVSAACWATSGHQVCGVDLDGEKVEMLNSGKSPIVEPGLESAVQEARRRGALLATSRVEEGLVDADLCFINVQTPTHRNGEIDCSFILNACKQIANAVAVSGKRQAVVIRSSILPGTFEQCCRVFESIAPGLIDLAVNPEFLREGSAVGDFRNPPLIVIGTFIPRVAAMLRQLFAASKSQVYVLAPAEALLVKYASNAFHGLKVAFANEIGTLCATLGADADVVMSTFCADTVLNISPRYLKPGFAFGGPCLAKDIDALLAEARRSGLEVPVIQGITKSNSANVERAVAVVLELGIKRVGMLGFAFKPDTDDLRESPFVKLAAALLAQGVRLAIYDPNISIAKLSESNRAFVESLFSHFPQLLVSSLEELTSKADLFIIGHSTVSLEQFTAIIKRNSIVLDLRDLTVRTIAVQKEIVTDCPNQIDPSEPTQPYGRTPSHCATR
jgi:GDP-mannose 6-dehydrogenase